MTDTATAERQATTTPAADADGVIGGGNVATVQPTALATEQPSQVSASSLMLDRAAMSALYRLAEVMADGKVTVPKHLQGSVGDCLAVCMQAMQWGFNPFAVAQKTHLVNGTLGYEAQLVIAALNSSPALATRLNWRWSDNWKGVNGKTDKDDDHAVEVWAVVRGEQEPRVLRVSMAQVGSTRNSPNWEADPRQQIGYLAAKRWGRLHAPDVILGVYTPDELADGEIVNVLPPNATPTQVAQAAQPKVERTATHANQIADFEVLAKEQGFEAFKLAWSRLTAADRAAIGVAERDRIGKIGTEADALRNAGPAA